ncbi:hypothetical protein GF415_01575 [Candidatus Micrarchaeota archaeon]|nr:hypothetical protein [Candidatus Micrarchaeota archaeon]
MGEEKTSLDRSFNLAEKILLYISQHEPINDSFNELIEQSGIDEDEMKLNIERLEKAGLLEGDFIHSIGALRFTHAMDIKLSYSGLKEVDILLRRKQGIKEMEVNLGLLKFRI